MTDSHSARDTQAAPESHKPSTIRLVIRAEILPDKPIPPSPPQRWNRRAVGVTAAVAVLAVIGIGILLFRSTPDDATPTTPRPEAAQTVTAPAADAESKEPENPTAASTPPQSAVAQVPKEQPTVAITEVLPEPSQGALQTIRGTVRVSVRVTIDTQGSVSAATPEDRGPSRYFERLSIEAARQWKFTAVNDDEPRSRLLRFHFTREGTKAIVDD